MNSIVNKQTTSCLLKFLNLPSVLYCNIAGNVSIHSNAAFNSGPHFLCWITGVVPFNTWLISCWEENNCCYKLSNWQNDNYFHTKLQLLPFWVKYMSFRAFAQLVTTLISSQLEIGHVLDGTTFETQYRKWEPKTPLTQVRVSWSDCETLQRE